MVKFYSETPPHPQVTQNTVGCIETTRRAFLQQGALLAMGVAATIVAGGCQKEENVKMTSNSSKNRMPVLFVGHGSPMNAFFDNQWSRGFASLATLFPKPRAILAISAHWYVQGTWLTGMSAPETIHDFYGFPSYMYEVRYPAPGEVDLAKKVQRILSQHHSEVRNEWGLDHGSWSVLRHMYPNATVPVVQLSVDMRMTPAQMVAMTHSLMTLRHDNVLIFASGNITHNLRDALARMQTGDSHTPTWAKTFDAAVVTALNQRDKQRVLTLVPQTDEGRMAHPSPDHWLPLLYALGATDADDGVSYPIAGFDAGSLSMRSVLFS